MLKNEFKKSNKVIITVTDKLPEVVFIRVDGVKSIQFNPYVYLKHLNTSAGVSSSARASEQVQQTKDMMLQLLEFAFYKQQDMNLKLVRVVGELYHGKNLDSYA